MTSGFCNDKVHVLFSNKNNVFYSVYCTEKTVVRFLIIVFSCKTFLRGSRSSKNIIKVKLRLSKSVRRWVTIFTYRDAIVPWKAR